MIEVPFVDSLIARLAVHVFKVVNLLNLVFNNFTFLSSHHIIMSNLVDLLFALWTRVLHLLDPLRDAWVAVNVLA